MVPLPPGVSPVNPTEVASASSSLTVLSNPSRVPASRVNALSWCDVKLKLRCLASLSAGAAENVR